MTLTWRKALTPLKPSSRFGKYKLPRSILGSVLVLSVSFGRAVFANGVGQTIINQWISKNPSDLIARLDRAFAE